MDPVDDLGVASAAVSRWASGTVGCSDRELIDRLQGIEQLSRLVESSVVGVIGEADRRGAFVEDGHASVVGWCRAAVRWSDDEIRARVRCAKLVRALPTVGEALADARVGIAQVREIARARSNPRVRDQLDDAVAGILLTEATRLDHSDFRTVVRRWEQLADADGPDRDDEARHDRRAVTITWIDGTLHHRGRWTGAQGSWISEVFEAFCQAEWHADWEAARAAHGDTATAAMLPRTPAQRRADAFHAMCLAAATAPPDGVTSPTVDIVIDAATFEAAVTASAANRPIPPLGRHPADVRDRRCETLDGVVLHPYDVLTAAAVGHVRRVVVDSAGVVIDLGRRSRLFTGPSREAVWIRQRTCGWVGCRSRDCEIDHLQDWADGGTTDQRNGAPACGRHNRWKRTGIRPRYNPDTRTWVLTRPDGTTITPI